MPMIPPGLNLTVVPGISVIYGVFSPMVTRFVCIWSLISRERTFIIVPPFPEGNTVDKSKMCNIDGEIHNKTILKAGMIAGKLTAHKGVKDIKKCVEKCCAMDQCHVAMMLADHCYSVFCTNTDYCSPKPAPEETHHTNPTVAYVKRGDIASGEGLKYNMNIAEFRCCYLRHMANARRLNGLW